MNSNYDYQKEANISALFEEQEYSERKDALKALLEAFEKANVKYALACSFNLFIRGIVDEFHDFDFIVSAESIPAVKVIMEKMNAILVATGGNGYCESDQYFHYQLGRIDVDIISGFKILTFGTQIYYSYDPGQIETVETYEEGMLPIPLIPLEELFLLYGMMEGWQPKRKFKRVLIMEALKESPTLMFSEILEESLKEELPGWLKREVRKLLKNRSKRQE